MHRFLGQDCLGNDLTCSTVGEREGIWHNLSDCIWIIKQGWVSKHRVDHTESHLLGIDPTSVGKHIQEKSQSRVVRSGVHLSLLAPGRLALCWPFSNARFTLSALASEVCT